MLQIFKKKNHPKPKPRWLPFRVAYGYQERAMDGIGREPA